MFKTAVTIFAKRANLRQTLLHALLVFCLLCIIENA